MFRYRFTLIILCILLMGIAVACGNGDDKKQSADKTEFAPTTQSGVREPVVVWVNNQPILQTEFEGEVEIQLQNLDSVVADRAAFEAQVLGEMINMLLVRQYAARNQIIISNDALAAEMNTLNQLAQASGVELTTITGYPEAVIEQKVRENLILLEVSRLVTQDVPTTTVRIEARHILVRSPEEAQMILTQLEEGADFVELARQFSLDQSTAPIGGDLGLIYPGDLLQPEVERVLFSMPANSRYPEAVPSTLGYHILEVLNREENVLYPEDKVALQRQKVFIEWLNAQREAATIVYPE